MPQTAPDEHETAPVMGALRILTRWWPSYYADWTARLHFAHLQFAQSGISS